MHEQKADTVTVVRGTPAHVDAAWEILDRCRRALDARGIHQWDDVYPTREVIEADVANGRLWVLEVEGRVRASVALDSAQDPQYASVEWAYSEPALVVHRLCVDPGAWGRGYATQLMNFAERYAAEHGFASIRLDAYSANPESIHLYRRRGYRDAGQVYFPRRRGHFHCFELATSQSKSR